MRPPSITLHNYGGDELRIFRQVSAHISRASYSGEGVILVQKDAPLDLLLGMNFQPLLGVRFLQDQGRGKVLDLLQPAERLFSEGQPNEEQRSQEELPADTATTTSYQVQAEPSQPREETVRKLNATLDVPPYDADSERAHLVLRALRWDALRLTEKDSERLKGLVLEY